MEGTSSGLAVMELRYLVPTTNLSCCQPQSLTITVPLLARRAFLFQYDHHGYQSAPRATCTRSTLRTTTRPSNQLRSVDAVIPAPSWAFLPKQADFLIPRCQMPSILQKERPPLTTWLRHQHRAFRAVSRLHMRVPAQSSIVNRDAIPRYLALKAVQCRSATI